MSVTARGKQADIQSLHDSLNEKYGYPNTGALTHQYANIDQDGDDYVIVLPDGDEDHVKKHGKGKVEKGDTRKSKAYPL